MKKYIRYLILGSIYLAAFLFVLPSLPKHLSLADNQTAISTTELSSEVETNLPPASTENSEHTETFETEIRETEIMETEIMETESIENEITEPDTEAFDEYLYLTAIYNNVSKKSSNLNLRAEPSTDAEIIGKCSYGSELTILSYVNSDWVLVEYNGQTCYCYRKYLTINE